MNDPNGDFAIHENSVGDKFTINSAGNVGIGTSTPSAKLNVVGPTTGYGPTIFAGGGGDLLLNNRGALFFDGNYSYNSGNYIRPLETNTQSFATAGIERLRINPDGNIGIGTSSPGGKLEINYAGGQLKLTGGTVAAGLWTNSADLLHLADWNTGTKGLTINMTSGNVGIGTKSPNEMLTVNGTIYGKEVKVDLSVPAPDYVFNENYELITLEQLRHYITLNGHLPEVPSANEMADNGIKLGDMNMILLKKIEELTLYLIDVKNENSELRKQNEELRKEVLDKLAELEIQVAKHKQ